MKTTKNLDNHLSSNAIIYTVTRLLEIAGLEEGTFTVQGTSVALKGLTIDFHLEGRDGQDCFLCGKAKAFYTASADGKVKVPLFFSEYFAKWDRQTLTICPDILTISFALLSRYEETLSNRRDPYGRFGYADSLAKKYGFIDIPLVDEYGMLLRQELICRCPSLSLRRRNPTIFPTHDIDGLWRFRSLHSAATSILGGDLILRKSPRTALQSLKEVCSSRFRPERDPLYLACLELMAVSQENGLVSAFYFLGYGDEPDKRYDVSHPSVVALMSQLKHNGCTVGFHGGMGSCSEKSVYQAQKDRVDETNGVPTVVGRQHYLCYDPIRSPKIWEACGIREDLTLGFFDREGFRCGTCRPYPLYDLTADCPLSVRERPLILMDGTVQRYRGLTVEKALESARVLRDRVFAVGGDFVILWHNGSLGRGMDVWYRQFYKPLLQESVMVFRKQIDCAQNDEWGSSSAYERKLHDK